MRNQIVRWCLCLALATLILAGCRSQQLLPVSPSAASLPLLNAGQYIGMIEGFNPDNPASTQDSLDLAWRQAREAGMKVARLQIDWPELEPARGEYDRDALSGPLQSMQNQGLQTLLTISVYDSDGPVLPDYLENRELDEKQVKERFKALMEWVIPTLVEFDGWAIAIANEPDNAFAENGGLSGEILDFLGYSRGMIHQLNGDMAVTITMNIGNAAHSQQEMEDILDQVDIACFNVYGAAPYPEVRPMTIEENLAQLQQMMDMAGNKQVVLQELGMHADSSLMNSSPEAQRQFFETFFGFMQSQNQIRAAFVFQMVDWSPQTIDLFNSLFENSVPEEFVAQYSRVLATLGLFDYESGEARPAWREVLKWIKEF